MLFNSFVFIFGFVPVTMLGFFVLGRYARAAAAAWLALASLVFYAYWDVRYLFLLLGSIGFNYLAGRLLAHCAGNSRSGAGRALLCLAIAINLTLLGYCKYANFFIENVNALTGASLSIRQIVLPLGISFFTFTQIAFLIDTHKGTAREPKLIHFMLFVTYFPHLIAGPILHHKEMMPQFARADTYRFQMDNLATGIVIFAIGLVKKVVLADGIAVHVAPVFDAAEVGLNPLLIEAWSGALAYTFQLYFDFSGYCDMAIGLSWMLGIALPINFNSPYKASSIVDFWRRWHMTLSRFLRDYLYIALGGNRHGTIRRYTNLFATMVIGGLWHGAGWTFVVWGALHGAYLIVNHAWQTAARVFGLSGTSTTSQLTGRTLTFLAVVVGWVFFRAQTVDGAMRVLRGMLGLNGAAWPGSDLTGAVMAGVLRLDAATQMGAWLWCLVLAMIAFTLPNTQEIMRDHLSGITRQAPTDSAPSLLPLAFQRSVWWAAGIALLLGLGLASLPQPSSFLYFNF